MAYAAVTGSGRVGLVYPGKRFGRRTFAAAGVRLTLFRVQVVGPPAACADSLRRLAKAVRRP